MNLATPLASLLAPILSQLGRKYVIPWSRRYIADPTRRWAMGRPHQNLLMRLLAWDSKGQSFELKKLQGSRLSVDTLR